MQENALGGLSRIAKARRPACRSFPPNCVAEQTGFELEIQRLRPETAPVLWTSVAKEALVETQRQTD
jgi:hypothetical protein